MIPVHTAGTPGDFGAAWHLFIPLLATWNLGYDILHVWESNVAMETCLCIVFDDMFS